MPSVQSVTELRRDDHSRYMLRDVRQKFPMYQQKLCAIMYNSSDANSNRLRSVSTKNLTFEGEPPEEVKETARPQMPPLPDRKKPSVRRGAAGGFTLP